MFFFFFLEMFLAREYVENGPGRLPTHLLAARCDFDEFGDTHRGPIESPCETCRGRESCPQSRETRRRNRCFVHIPHRSSHLQNPGVIHSIPRHYSGVRKPIGEHGGGGVVEGNVVEGDVVEADTVV